MTPPTATTALATDHKVADLSLAEFGRNEIRLAEHEMPGLMAMREEYGPDKPLTGARVTGSPPTNLPTPPPVHTPGAPPRPGRPRHRLAAHDRADRRADRDAGRPRRRGALGELQHLLHAGPRGGRDRRR